MVSFRNTRQFSIVAALFGVVLLALSVWAQLPPSYQHPVPRSGDRPPAIGTTSRYRPPSYADYYKQQLKAYKRPPVNSEQYVWDRYFGGSTHLSPYLDLSRNSGPGVNNYYSYVRPELDRRRAKLARELAPVPPKKTVPHTLKPDRQVRPYYQQYYGLPK